MVSRTLLPGETAWDCAPEDYRPTTVIDVLFLAGAAVSPFGM
jgi:hypothetical protein